MWLPQEGVFARVGPADQRVCMHMHKRKSNRRSRPVNAGLDAIAASGKIPAVARRAPRYPRHVRADRPARLDRRHHHETVAPLQGQLIQETRACEFTRYFPQADFFGALTGLKSLPPAAMPSPLHFLHQMPFSCGPGQEIEKRSCLLMRPLSHELRMGATLAPRPRHLFPFLPRRSTTAQATQRYPRSAPIYPSSTAPTTSNVPRANAHRGRAR